MPPALRGAKKSKGKKSAAVLKKTKAKKEETQKKNLPMYINKIGRMLTKLLTCLTGRGGVLGGVEKVMFSGVVSPAGQSFSVICNREYVGCFKSLEEAS